MKSPSLKPRIAVALLACLLAGCAASAPIHYYTLQGALPPAANKVAARYAIAVLPVAVPEQVNSQPLVLSAGQGRLTVEDNHQWAAPLSDEIRQALSQNLSQLLGAEDVYDLPHGQSQLVYQIHVKITRFDSSYGRSAAILANWSIQAVSGNSAPLVCHSQEVESVSSGYDALVQGHQRALEQLARRIATALRSLVAGEPHCPAGR